MPERLLPHHLAGESFDTQLTTEKKPAKGAKETETAGAAAERRHRERGQKLREAPPLEEMLRKEETERGIPIDEKVNLSLKLIEGFRYTGRRLKKLNEQFHKTADPKERKLLLAERQKLKNDMREYLAYGPSFERSYREFLRQELKFFTFTRLLEEKRRLSAEMFQSSFSTVPMKKQGRRDLGNGQSEQLPEIPDYEGAAMIEHLMRTSDVDGDMSEDEIREALKTDFDEGTEEYEAEVAKMLAVDTGSQAMSVRDREKRLAEIDEELHELWRLPRVQYFWNRAEKARAARAILENQDVIETPSALRVLNRLAEIERAHDRTTIGGVLVGEPGVGKTTMVRHYLRETDRKDFVYIDLSQDVTRYMLFGSKSMEFRSAADTMTQLLGRIQKMDEKEFESFVGENSITLKQQFECSDDEAMVLTLNMMKEAVDQNAGELTPELQQALPGIRHKMEKVIASVYHRDLAEEFLHTVKNNGWRDGVVVSALRNNKCIIFDEFNKNKNWSLLYSLMTAKPGEKWHFADNIDDIDIPLNWRMYFTGNIGSEHDVFDVKEAEASRAAAKVIWVDHPPVTEVLTVALASISTPDGDLIRTGKGMEKDMAEMIILVSEVFPRIQEAMRNFQGKTVPATYRMIRDLGNELIQYRVPGTNKPLERPQDKSFDAALLEVLVNTFNIYGDIRRGSDDSLVKQVIKICLMTGLLHDPAIRGDVEPLVGKEFYDKEIKAHEVQEGDAMRKIQDLFKVASFATELPTGKTF